MAESGRHEIINEMNSFKWVHSIDLGDGLRTPGQWGEHSPPLMQAVRDIDFTGKKVLDIGCWDGLFSFEAEKLGAAEVYATDIVSQRPHEGQPTFRFAQRVLDSRAVYYPNMFVYEVERLGIRDFDVVLFMGVYYHLKDPLRALATLRRVMKDGGIILVEGAILEDPGCFARFYYKDTFCGDDSNWWVPTIECLRQWIEANYFEIQAHEYPRWGHLENQRHIFRATAASRDDSRYSFVDPELKQFDLRPD